MKLVSVQLQIKITLEREGAPRMGTALGISKQQLLFLVLVILSLLIITVITAFFVVHATAPNPFHEVAILGWHFHP
jgi:hypothetical protein